MSKWRLCLLVAAQIGLLVWVWATDYPSPAYPHGRLPSIVLSGLLGGFIVWVMVVAGIAVWQAIRKARVRR